MPFAGYAGKRSSVGRYELIEQLGEGGMGVVWRALDSKTGGDVAIKIMKDISDEASLALFAKEWRALAEMSHPNIVDVRDVDELTEDNERRPFFVMPLLRGTTLAELIRDSSARLTLTTVVEITDQVCRGLQAAHQRGLIHRDLKPSNIFVMDDDTAKIIDFGVVYLAGSQSVTGIKGTFQYMSPEQVQMKEVTPASDIFSLGVILYESLTARKPFACLTAEETMQAILKRMPPPVSELSPAIPHAISQVVHKCLAKQPINRYSSARELAETLKKAYRGEPVFDVAKLRVRVERAKAAFRSGDGDFASELLTELESEGHLDPELTVLRLQIETFAKRRKVRYLLESARARIEQDEIPLGLDKLRELLELDPENSDALALKASTEKHRNETQAGKWMDLASTHLANSDFSAARHAVQEALSSRPGDPRGIELQRKIDGMELEAKRVREQKEQLYGTAIRDYQNGEIDSALSRMVRLFSVLRSRPEGAAPERDAVYESFYQEVRSEHDSIRSKLDEAQRQLGEENFAAALAICAEILGKYPNNGAFQALKIQIEDTERQRISAYIAMVSRTVDGEPDYDRRVAILRDACERYPREPQFEQQLKVVRERRDLVNSIVAKARQLGERSQYNEELGQWDMLRNIHPRFPGLAFEFEQCRKKRDLQARNEEKAHLVEEIVGAMEARDFERALEQTRLALADFQGDTELAGLEKLSREGLERNKETSRRFAEGQLNAAAGNWLAATGLLEDALRLDQRHAAARDLLVQVLTEQAHLLLDSDVEVAGQLHQRASELDSNHAAVRSIGLEIAEARHQSYVGECLTKARSLVAIGDMDAAFESISQGRKKYPKDVRLEQFEALLFKESRELQLRQERLQHLEKLDAARVRLESDPNSEKARNVLEMAHNLRDVDPDSPEMLQGIAAAEQTVKSVLNIDDLSSLLRPETLQNNQENSARPAEVKQVSESENPKKPHHNRSEIRIFLVSASAILLLGSAGLIYHYLKTQPSATPRKTPTPTTIHFAVSPVGSVLKVKGLPQQGGDVAVPANSTLTVEVSHLGYESKTIQLNSDSRDQSVALPPLRTHVSVTTAEKSGFIELDGNKVGDLVEGSFDDLDVPSDGQSHTLVLNKAGHKLASFTFQTNAGQRPTLAPITSNRDWLVIASLGPTSTIYGGGQLKSASIDGTAISLGDSGIDVPGLGEQPKELQYSDGSETSTLSLNATTQPTILVRSVGAGADYILTSNVEAAVLTANGKMVNRSGHGWHIKLPGTYNLVLTADNYETQTWTVILKRGQTLPPQSRALIPKVDKAAMPTLTLTGGTPGAQIDLDGKLVGQLDSNGFAKLPALTSKEKHQIQFRKDGFCSSSLDIFTAESSEQAIAAPKLDPCGTITPQQGPQDARVKARSTGDAKWIDLPVGKKTSLHAGRYDLNVEGEGFNPSSSQITIEAGRDLDYPVPPLTPKLHCQLANAGDANREGDWWKSKSSNKVIYLSPGCSNISFQFYFGGKLKINLFATKHVEWVIETADGAGRIEYELSDQKLSRKSTVKKTFDQHETNVSDLDTVKGIILINLRVDGSHIQLTNHNGDVLDDYTPQNPVLHDLEAGRVGVKTSANFVFRDGSR